MKKNSFEIKGTRFRLTPGADGTPEICRTRNSARYHTARQATKSCWHILRDGRRVTTILSRSEIDPRDICECLLRADLGADLITWNDVYKAH